MNRRKFLTGLAAIAVAAPVAAKALSDNDHRWRGNISDPAYNPKWDSYFTSKNAWHLPDYPYANTR